jgi:PAS domain S-box-containing protein
MLEQMKTGIAMPAARGAIRRILTAAALPWLILAVGIPVFVLLFLRMQDSVEGLARARFERQANDANGIIENRLRSYTDVLFALKALFASEKSVDRLRFHDYIQSLDLKDRYPGFDSLNYAAHVRARDKAAFEDAVRHDTSLSPGGYPDFRIKPPGERPEYFVVVFLEPMAGYEFAFGLDIGSNPAAANPGNILAALYRARDTGELLSSGEPLRVMRGKPSVYVAMRLPVYRNGMAADTVEQRRAAYLGSVGAGINIENLMRGVLDGEMLRSARIRLYDAGLVAGRASSASARGMQLLFDSDQLLKTSSGQSPLLDAGATFVQVLPVEMAGRIWNFQYSTPKEAMIGRLDKTWPWLLLVGGVLSTLLVAGVLYALSRSRGQAIRLATEITKDFRESEARFRLISESASDLITLLDSRGRRVYVNPAYRKLFGDSEVLAIGADGLDVVHPEERARVAELFAATINHGIGWRTELRFLLPGGEIRYIESHGNRVQSAEGRDPLVVVVARDVTDRRLTEEALRSREVQLQEAQEIANLGIWDWNMRTDEIAWSSELFRIFGIARERFLANHEGFLTLVHPEDRERVAMAKGDIKPGDTSYENSFRIVRPDGAVRVLYSRGQVVRDETGQPVRLLGVCQDITDRIWVEEQVRISQERFRMMVENVRDYAIFMLDPEGCITSWNLGSERIKGYTAEEIHGRHHSYFFPPESSAEDLPRRQLEIAAIEGRHESEGWRVRKDGSRFWAHETVTRLRDDRGKLYGFSKITHDITQRRQAEEDLRSYADRLRAVSGRLVEVQEAERRLLATELHDRVGQNLTALGLNLRLVASGVADSIRPEAAARLQDSENLVKGTVDAIRNVMGELRPQVLDDYGLLAALRSHASGFSRRTGIQVSVDGGGAPGGLLPKSVDVAMFRIAQEALNNVAKHSRANHVEIALQRANGHAKLSIRDDGVGFDPEHVEASNPDAGWGLLIMRERAEAVGAKLKLDANPGAGVRVLVEYRI